MKRFPRVHQLGFIVDDAKKAMKEYGDIFQIRKWYRAGSKEDDPMYYNGERIHDPGFSLYVGYCGDTEIEIITTGAEESLYANFLKEYGPGLHHISFFSTKMEKGLEELRKLGFEKVQNGLLTATATITEYAYMAKPGEKFSRIVEFSSSSLKGLRVNRSRFTAFPSVLTHDLTEAKDYVLEHKLNRKIRMNKIGFVVDDLDKAIKEYGDIYHVKHWFRPVNEPKGKMFYRGQEITDDSFDSVIGYCGATELELITTTNDNNMFGKFLRDRGPGLNHFCFFVKDIESAENDYEDMGFEVLQKGSIQGKHMRSYYTFLTRPGEDYNRIVELGETKLGRLSVKRNALNIWAAVLTGDVKLV